MASDNNDIDTTHAVAQAMNQVLQAEREGNQAVAECEREAQRVLHETQQGARRIADRTDERITHLHMRCKHLVDTRISELERAYSEQQRGLAGEQLDEKRLADVIERVAASLSGDNGSTPDSGQSD